MRIEDHIREVPDFPRKGIRFQDIMPLLQSPEGLVEAVARLAATTERPDAVVGIESRGFLFGVPLAMKWAVPFVPARKFGKLPGNTVRQVYSLEYGEDTLELQADALRAGQKVVLVDDLLATGGTALAALQLVRQLGADVSAALFVIELLGLGGREKLAPLPVHALIHTEVDE